MSLLFGRVGTGIAGWTLCYLLASRLPSAQGHERSEIMWLGAAGAVLAAVALLEAAWGYRVVGDELRSGPFGLPVRRVPLSGAEPVTAEVPWGHEEMTGVALRRRCPTTEELSEVPLRLSPFIGSRRRHEWLHHLRAHAAA